MGSEIREQTGEDCPWSDRSERPEQRGVQLNRTRSDCTRLQAETGTGRDAEPGGLRAGWLLEDMSIRETLQKIVRRSTADADLHHDLMQECLVCLWKAEGEKPGRTRSWYLQHCRFRIQHWLDLGRSVDSPKRAKAENQIRLDGVNDETVLGEYHTNGDLFDGISCRDLVGTLARHLAPREQVVLKGLAAGMVLREVAARFSLSYPTALKYRRKIAALTLKLGAAPSRAKRKAEAPSLTAQSSQPSV